MKKCTIVPVPTLYIYTSDVISAAREPNVTRDAMKCGPPKGKMLVAKKMRCWLRPAWFFESKNLAQQKKSLDPTDLYNVGACTVVSTSGSVYTSGSSYK